MNFCVTDSKRVSSRRIDKCERNHWKRLYEQSVFAGNIKNQGYYLSKRRR
jgi:hypothetical protein